MCIYLILYCESILTVPLIKKYAPLVRLAKGEAFRASSVDFFLQHVDLKGADPTVSPLTVYNLPTCSGSCYLTTKESLGGSAGTKPTVLKGQAPADSPTYAMISKEGKTGDFSVKYWFFFPYNRGKRVCVGLYQDWLGGCTGGYSTFGNHVGDWEHVKVTFRNSKPTSIYLSIHDFGKTFTSDGTTFNGLSMIDSHPVVYAADGSHGIWPNTGTHTYKNIYIDTLSDSTSAGTKWETWKNLKIVYNKAKGQFTGEFSFFNFKGDWGNSESGCNSVIDKCILVGGPSGPPK